MQGGAEIRNASSNVCVEDEGGRLPRMVELQPRNSPSGYGRKDSRMQTTDVFLMRISRLWSSTRANCALTIAHYAGTYGGCRAAQSRIILARTGHELSDQQRWMPIKLQRMLSNRLVNEQARQGLYRLITI